MAFLISLLIIFFPNYGWANFIRQEGLIQRSFDFVAVSPFDDNLIYASGGDCLFKKNGKGWQIVYKLPNGRINFIYPSRYQAGRIYIASDKGLMVTTDAEHFDYIFQRRGRETRCVTVTEFKDKLYLGTTDGLYSALSGIYNFKKVTGLPEDFEVWWLTRNKDFLYIAGSLGVYVTTDGINFSCLYLIPQLQEEKEELQSQEEESVRFKPTVIAVDYARPGRVFLGTTNGIFVSIGGESFKRKYVSGLPQTRINHIYQDRNSPHIVYIATDKGLYKYYPQTSVAMEVKDGLPTSEINCIAIDSKGKIYLATDRGLFVEGRDSKEIILYHYEKYLGEEPSFREVQEAALRYNEVSPEKIRAWRKRLKIRAIMPQIDLGYDKTINYYRGNFWTGPRDWSVDFSWDLGNLIWNSYEDDVDTRSRLNTQLRLDILEDVNHLYFERKRVKLELLNNPPQDKSEYLKKLLYLEELTAALDGYTGGYFSKHLQELQGQKDK